MISIGLTGGIGSGKTTVARLWESMGAFVLYADDLAKKLMVESQEIKKMIRKEFGEEAYAKDGSLNRGYLAAEAFGKDRVEALNRIVHPHVFQQADKIRAQAEKDGYKVFVHESALLLKYGRPDNIDFVVIVSAPAEMRIKRVTERDHSRPSDVTVRIKKQADFDTMKRQADYIIVNSGTLRELEDEARKLYIKLTG